MAGLNFNDLKNKVTSSFRREEDYSGDYENEEAYEESYDEQYDDGQYDDGQYDDAQYDDAEYDDQYDDGQYDDGQYDDGQYDDGQYDDGQYDDAEYDDAEYDDQYGEGVYDDAEYGDEAYDDGYEEETADTLGYNPDLFNNLGNEDDYEDAYDEEGYDDQGYDAGYDEGEYAEEGYDDQGSEPAPGLIGYISENDWVMYAALVILPPLGIWLLWRKNKFDITLRGALSAASLIWFVIVLIWLFTRGNTTPDITQPPVDFTNTAVPSVTTSVPTDAPTAEPSTQPTARVTSGTGTGTGTGDGNTGTAGGTYVYVTNNGVYYHTDEHCGDMPNANKVTLETATIRGLTACPTCAGGTNLYTQTGTNDSPVTASSTFYATKNGSWYHVNPNCQGMTGASVVTEANAIKAGKTACPTCIGYFGTPGGSWYHNISNCQSMSNAITKTKEEWIAMGKTACPKCLGGSSTGTGTGTTSTPTQTTVYATADGKWYHTKSDCQGMKGATTGSISSAASMNKTACPKCVSTSTLYVFATTNGTYFHTKANCSGMKNPQYVIMKTAISNKKSACPQCANMLAGLAGTVSTGNGTTVPTVNTTDTATYVYATTDGTYFHTDSTCTGMKNAKRITYEKAVSSGKKVCPTCVKTSSLTVFCTADGTYYHTSSTCSGMKGAVPVKASTAISNGKKACPTCARALASAGGSSNLGGTTTPEATATYVYATTDGTYFHTDSTCSGMKNAARVTYEKAVANGKKACPTCVKPASVTVFCTADGTYYHTNATCSGMKDAAAVSASKAINAGKKACPVCAKALSTSTVTAPVINGVTVPVVNTSDTMTYVYATADGTYYHTDSTCSGMKNAVRITYEKAVANGKKPCPTCIKSSAVTVFATADGKYYHTDSTCSGMKNAVPVKASTAISFGKAACPTCAKSLASTAPSAAPTIAPVNVVVEPTTTVKAGITATSMIYVKPGTKYYHVASRCAAQGISGATNATLEYALGHGYSACPSCNPPKSY